MIFVVRITGYTGSVPHIVKISKHVISDLITLKDTQNHIIFTFVIFKLQ